MKTLVYSVLLHSCQLDLTEKLKQYLVPGERYIFVGNGYRVLPKRCRCKKQVTRAKAEQLMADGVAEIVYKTRCRRVQTDYTRIWMAQQPQVPRVDLVSEADIVRAYVDGKEQFIEYIEECHRLFMESRQKLIRYVSAEVFDKQKRLDENVPVVYSYGDHRTPGGISK